MTHAEKELADKRLISITARLARMNCLADICNGVESLGAKHRADGAISVDYLEALSNVVNLLRAALVAIPKGPIPEPKFADVGCSSCGQSFGPGDAGFSHCQDHAHLVGRDT